MEDHLKSGGSINNPWLSNLDNTTNLGTSSATVDNRTSMSQEPTQIGGKFSGEEVNTSSMSITKRPLMFTKTRILKDKRLSSGRNTMVWTKDGELFTLTNQPRKDLKDGMENMDSISWNHST
jgi:hypothetical protein